MQLIDTTQMLIGRAMTGASMRNTALSDNIANANTPGFQPKDVDFHSALAEAMDDGRSAVMNFKPSVQVDQDAPIRPDGSGFDIDQQASQLAANGLEYQALSSAFGARSAIMRAAMGR